jgi:hypothetical protein
VHMLSIRSWFVLSIGLLMYFSLYGCATQLAPPYDKAVADGLNEASSETMTLLASSSGGTQADTYASREGAYNSLVGKLDSLAILAGARPVPDQKTVESINRILEKRGIKPLGDDDATPPSTHAISKISDTLAKMRDTDKKQGVTAMEVQAFKGQITIYFDQAITYENFLQR